MGSDRFAWFIRKFFRLVLRTGADAYAFKLANHYYDLRLALDPGLFDRVRRLRSTYDLRNHYAYAPIEGNGLRHIEIQLAGLISRLEESLKTFALDGRRVLDAGDSDGLVLSSCGLGRQGVSLNLLDVCVKSSRAKGIDAVRANIEELPFRDRAFPVVFCFEAVEHLENPIRGLRELARVASDRIFVTIPHVERTCIHEDNYTRGGPVVHPEPEHHVFEFSSSDFSRILSHANLFVRRQGTITIFPPIANPWHRFILRLLYAPSFFPAFQFYELEPVRARPEPRESPGSGARAT